MCALNDALRRKGRGHCSPYQVAQKCACLLHACMVRRSALFLLACILYCWVEKVISCLNLGYPKGIHDHTLSLSYTTIYGKHLSHLGNLDSSMPSISVYPLITFWQELGLPEPFLSLHPDMKKGTRSVVAAGMRHLVPLFLCSDCRP